MTDEVGHHSFQQILLTFAKVQLGNDRIAGGSDCGPLKFFERPLGWIKGPQAAMKLKSVPVELHDDGPRQVGSSRFRACWIAVIAGQFGRAANNV